MRRLCRGVWYRLVAGVALGALFGRPICTLATDLRIPYYSREGTPDWSWIDPLFMAAEVDLSAPLADTAAALCVSAGGRNLDDSMVSAVDGWVARTSHCKAYMIDYLTVARLAAQLPPPTPPLSERYHQVFTPLDQISFESGGEAVTEGNIWHNQGPSPGGPMNKGGVGSDGGRRENEIEDPALLLHRKRTCLMTALAVLQPERIGEVGFNAGHSASAFLSTLPRTTVVSFDLCAWPYTNASFDQVRSEFGEDRLKLVCGDSQRTLPAYREALATHGSTGGDGGRFDAVFIDGGHL